MAIGTTDIDEAKLEAFMGQAVLDMGAIISAPLFLIGERLGLYRAMAGAGPLTSLEVAERAGASERNVREWLRNQAAGGYVTYDAASDRYTLPDEQALALADEDSPFYILGVYDLIASLYIDEERIIESFRSGSGMGWHEHDQRLFRGTERFFRPGYRAHLVTEWIPALDGVKEKLQQGARSPMWAAATAPRQSSWPRHSPTRASRASITTWSRSSVPVIRPTRPVSRIASCSRRRGQGVPRPRLRPGVRLRLPARHG